MQYLIALAAALNTGRISSTWRIARSDDSDTLASQRSLSDRAGAKPIGTDRVPGADCDSLLTDLSRISLRVGRDTGSVPDLLASGADTEAIGTDSVSGTFDLIRDTWTAGWG